MPVIKCQQNLNSVAIGGAFQLNPHSKLNASDESACLNVSSTAEGALIRGAAQQINGREAETATFL